MLRGVPEAPRVYPKYYTQTVAITSKPEISHSTFLIPAARLLSWAPHEEPLLERERSCISPSACFCLSLSVSPPVSSLLSLSHPLPVYLYLFYLPSPVLGFVAHSPTHFFPLLASVCIFFSVPRPASRLPLMLLVCTSPPPLYKALTLPPFLLSLFLSPHESPDIHVEISSHVRYRSTTPARSLWPLNLIPSTKPHCFLVCVWACLLCVHVGKYVWGCVFMHYQVEVGDF